MLTEKLNVLRNLIGQSVATHKAQRGADGTQSHRFVLFVVDDNTSIAEYYAELENEDFTVAAYTLALHTSSVNEWPSVVYNDVIIVAANLLLDSLTDGNVRIPQAHMMVVSDAQRLMPLQIPHPVMRIMTDYYAKMMDAPRVLATVTSAPDRWASLDLVRLEISFGASSYFLASRTVDAWSGPLELVLEYDAYTPAAPDSVATSLQEADPDGLLLRPRVFRKARRILQQLGPFAYNMFWKATVDELEVSTARGGIGFDSNGSIRQKLAELRKQWSDDALVTSLSSSACNITPKLAKLIEVLSSYDGPGSGFRGVVLVKDRSIARTLAKLLQIQEIGLPFIRAVEVDHAAASDPGYQHKLTRAFGGGQYNLLVLTQTTADVEFPLASTVISFDLFEDQLTYAHCHARGKGRHSHLLYLIEKGNNEQRKILTRVQTVDADLRGWIAGFVGGDSKHMPPRTMHTTLDPCLSDSDSEEEDGEFVLDPTTSAHLHRPEAEAAIHRLVAGLQDPAAPVQDSPSISLERKNEQGAQSYRYTISLPISFGFPDVVGPYCLSKTQARREAFYKACEECVRSGIMNYQHFPQPRWQPPDTTPAVSSDAPQDVKSAISSTAIHGYPRKSPDFWANSPRYPVTTLYPTMVVPENLGGEPHAPVAILTRAPLPQMSEFLLFFSGARATIRFYRGVPFDVNSGQLHALRGYTNRVVRSLTNKPFDCTPESLLCFFTPLNASWQPLAGVEGLQPVAEHIPWDAVQLAADYYAVPLFNSLTALDDNARDAVVQDRNVEFTMRHFLVKIRHDLTPLSKAEDSPREAEYSSFLEYCKARRKDFPGLEDEKQPMVEVSAVPAVTNNLHPMSTPPTPPTKAPLKCTSLSPEGIPRLYANFWCSTFRTLWLLPSIMSKIDSCLLVKELDAKLFHHSISEPQLLIALSTRAAWTEFNYERLEFLGDAFLKVIASNFLYVTMPTAGEGVLHNTRQGIIGNKVLHECAMRVGICPYIQHKRFVAKLWQPPHVPAPSATQPTEDVEMADGEGPGDGGEGKSKRKKTKKERQLSAQNTLWMGDKVVADVVEAILAAAFLSGGHEGALQAARRLQIPLPNIAQWTDFTRIGAQQGEQDTGEAKAFVLEDTVEAVQAIVGSVFSKPELLAQALTHGSAFGSTEGVSYERLEFIGDAILDFLVARHIFQRHPNLSPGGLTLLKGGMVSNRALAAFCVNTGLHRHLHFESDQLADAIQRYVTALTELREKEYEAVAREQRLPGQYWLDLPLEPPKCLSDLVESILGALYVCDGFFEVGVGRFFDAVFKPFMDAHVRLQTLSTNPKVTLLELLQAEGCRQHAVVKVPQDRQNAPVHMEVHVHGQVIASATDPTAAIATRKVSLAALDAMANNPELLWRVCDCVSGETTKKPAHKATQGEDEGGEGEETMETAE
ncbi:Dicer-like protein 1 [Trametes pubescens]|uniref:Dicer-like protein 1 n=1 Tax=Trametes pubescens TaxID=154538 RepID=A0A1M2W0P6_TRAPU|nr:Dicer-like protein 1 [Trametes pubescens]